MSRRTNITWAVCVCSIKSFDRKKKAPNHTVRGQVGDPCCEVPGTGLEPARPKAQPPEDCASTNFATRVGVFQLSKVEVPRAGLEPARPNGHMALNHACLPISAPGQCDGVTPLGLEPRTLSLKVRCSNQLSYEVVTRFRGGKDRQNFHPSAPATNFHLGLSILRIRTVIS